jgi:hypothetical protein
MRRRRSEAQVDRERLCTVAWIHAVQAAPEISDGLPRGLSPLELQKALVLKHRKILRSFHRSHRFRDYFLGKPTPELSTLKQFDALYPGTQEVFQHGPDRSHLWDAIFCPDAESAASNFFQLKSDIQQGVPAERRVRRRRVSKQRRPGTAKVLIPDSLARALGVSKEQSLNAVTAELAERLKKNPQLAESLSYVLEGEDPLDVTGLLIQLMPDVTFLAKTRRTESVFVRPPPLAGLALQILQTKISQHSTVRLDGWSAFFILSRLRDFGVSGDEVERLSGLRFRPSRPTKMELAAIRRFRETVRKLEPDS